MSLRQVENNEMLLNTTSKQMDWLTNNISENNYGTVFLNVKRQLVYFDVTAERDWR